MRAFETAERFEVREKLFYDHREIFRSLTGFDG